MKREGERILPCGTPAFNWNLGPIMELIIICAVLLVVKLHITIQ